MRFNITSNGETSNVAVLVDGRIVQADSNHPNYQTIVDALLSGQAVDSDLFDIEAGVVRRFQQVSERVSVANGKVFFDGDEVAGPLAEQVNRAVESGLDDYLPLVKFWENLASNPNEHSRENLYRWLKAHEFTITDDGLLLGYKGVRQSENGYQSVHRGSAVVNGEVIEGNIPNQPGSVITMPRSDVQHDPSVGCHTGLHVGTWNYANDFGSVVLEVHVNPRDVVSVPTDCGDAKLRTCRYEVKRVLNAPYNAVVAPAEDYYDYDEDEEYDEYDYDLNY